MKTIEESLIETTEVKPVLQIASADDVKWDEEADLVVVGFGGAGASAALDGAERGARVIAIDRFEGGGATAYSGGVYYACETETQKDAGVQDSVEEMYKYLNAEGTPVKDETLRRFCDDSAANFNWVKRHVPYDSALYTGKTTYPPEGKFLYYSGNEKTPKFSDVAKPAPRGHRAVGKGYTGHVFYDGLRKGALDAGVKLMTHAPAQRLMIDSRNVVVGVEVRQIHPDKYAEHQRLYREVTPHLPMRGLRAEAAIKKCRSFEAANSTTKLIRSRGGVVLATGGFIYNLKLLEQHRPDLAKAYAEIVRLGSMGCDGSGMALGATVGGYVDLMKNGFIGKVITPPEVFLHGILVNTQGTRFINEDAYTGLVGEAIVELPDSTAYLVMDGATFWKGFWTALTMGPGMFYFWGVPALLNIVMGGTRRGSSLRALAEKIRANPDNLERTVQDYNDRVLANAPDEFGKLPANRAVIGKGPYYAINVSLRNKFGIIVAFTLGGLRVNEETGQVLRKDGSSVPGLYVAGRTGVSVCSAGYISGMSLADLVFSGRRAASHAVASLGLTR